MRFRDKENTELVVLDFGLAFQLSFYELNPIRQTLNQGSTGYICPELLEKRFPYNTPGTDVMRWE